MKILLFGEFGIDEFIYGDCKRLNPEAPTPVFTENYRTTNLGMAGNVSTNIRSLGVDVDFFYQPEQIKKTRFVDEKSNYILLRVDKESSVTPLTVDHLRRQKVKFDDYDAVVISDYNKGYLSEEVIEYILENSHLSFIDTKKPFGRWIQQATYIKVNESESQNPGHDKQTISDIWYKLIITKGGNGCDLNGVNYPTKKTDVRDVVGAGDTFISALSAAYVKTVDIEKAIKFANECATHVIEKRGVCDLEDMRFLFEGLS